MASPVPLHAPVPDELRTESFLLRPIRESDTERDYAAVMETREELRLWEQSSWPADDFTVDDNRTDVVDLQTRHDAGRAFTYTVVDPLDTEAWGCVYVLPPTATFLAKATATPLGEIGWQEMDAVAYFWVRSSLSAQGFDTTMLETLRTWFAEAWSVTRVGFVVSEPYERQVKLLQSTDLTPAFELREPDKPGHFLIYV
jgi:hypothetical protein